jgi:hypothetical protein
MSHLGQRISALIDGELTAAERDRVLAHLAGCDACRQEAIALRALKRRMHSLGEAMVDAALTGRLMAVGEPAGEGRWSARAPWRPRAGYSATRLLTAGILASAMAGLGAAAFFAGGDQPAPGPRVTPAVDNFLIQHAIVTGYRPVAPSGPAAASPGRGPVTSGAAASRPAAARPAAAVSPGQPATRALPSAASHDFATPRP